MKNLKITRCTFFALAEHAFRDEPICITGLEEDRCYALFNYCRPGYPKYTIKIELVDNQKITFGYWHFYFKGSYKVANSLQINLIDDRIEVRFDEGEFSNLQQTLRDTLHECQERMVTLLKEGIKVCYQEV